MLLKVIKLYFIFLSINVKKEKKGRLLRGRAGVATTEWYDNLTCN